MSWSSLRSLTLRHNRADLDPVCQSENELLDRLVSEFETVEGVAKTINQAARKLSAQILCTSRFELSLTNNLSYRTSLFMQDNFMRDILDGWSSFASTSQQLGDEYVLSLKKSLIEPLQLMQRAFHELRAKIKTHNNLELIVIKLQRKVANYHDKERTGSNLVKVQEIRKMLAVRRQEFSRLTQQLVASLSRFLTESLLTLRPMLEEFIAAELAWIHSSKRSMERRLFSPFQCDWVQSQGARNRSMEDSMRALGSLSICSDSR